MARDTGCWPGAGIRVCTLCEHPQHQRRHEGDTLCNLTMSMCHLCRTSRSHQCISCSFSENGVHQHAIAAIIKDPPSYHVDRGNPLHVNLKWRKTSKTMRHVLQRVPPALATICDILGVPTDAGLVIVDSETTETVESPEALQSVLSGFTVQGGNRHGSGTSNDV